MTAVASWVSPLSLGITEEASSLFGKGKTRVDLSSPCTRDFSVRTVGKEAHVYCIQMVGTTNTSKEGFSGSG